MAKRELNETDSKNLWKSKKSDAIAFEEGKNQEIPAGDYVLGKFVATEGAIKDSDAVTFHYDLGDGLKLYTKHINSTTIDDFDECLVESKKGGFYVIARNRYQNVLLSQMNALKGKKVHISKDVNGKSVAFKQGGYADETDAKTAYDKAKVETVYKVEFL